MTETAPEQTETAADTAPQAPFGHFYPQKPENPHESPLSVNFAPGRAPQVTVRGRTVSEWRDLLEEAMDSGVFTVIGAAYEALNAQASMGKGLGPASPVNGAQAPVQAPPAAPQQQFAPAGPNYNPQLPPPGQPGQAPAAWQNAGAPPQQQFVPQGPQLPQGWYKLNVPFPQKGAFDAIVAQYGIRKGDPGRGGQVSFQKATKSWYCAPEVAQAFGQFSPVPA